MRGRILLVLLAAAALCPTEALALACVSTVTGNWSAPGTWTTCGGGIPGAADTVTLNGGTVTVNIGTAVASSVQLGVNGGGNGTLTFNAGSQLTVSGTVTLGNGNRNGVVTMTAGGTLSAGGLAFVRGTWTPGAGTLVLTANNTLPNNTGIDTFNNLTIASGTTTLSRAITINGDLAIATGAGWDGAGQNVDLNGDFTNNGAFTAGTGTFLFSGAALESLTGTNGGTTTFTNLSLNNAANLQLTGTHSITVSTLLTLTNGVIVTNANVVYVSNGSAIASAGGNDFIQGNLKKSFPTGTNVARVFEVGTGTTYSPVTVTFASVTGAGDVTVSATAGSHPQLATSGLDTVTPAKLNRWWTITNSGVVFTTYTAAFTYVAGDIDAGASSAGFSAMRLASGTWNPTTLSAIPTNTSLTISGETGFGDIAIGNSLGGNPIAGSGARFNAYDPAPLTPAGAIDGHIRTKIAGVVFSLTLVHTNGAGTALATINTAVTVTLMDATNNTGTFVNNCGPNWAVIQTLTPNPNFGNVNTITVNNIVEPNAWKEVRVRITGGGQTGCSNDRFAIRPSGLVLEGLDNDWQTAGTTRQLNNTSVPGGTVHAASTAAAATPRPFTFRVTAFNGATPTPIVTTNYSGPPAVKTGPTLVLGTVLGTLDIGTWSATSGVLTAVSNYSEVGAFSLEVQDTTFADVDKVDTPDSQRTIPQIGTVPVTVGRFVPDHFFLSGASLTNRFSAACGVSSFTYLGEDVGLTFTLLARNAANAVTQNYNSTLAQLNPSSPSVFGIGVRATIDLTSRASSAYQSPLPGNLPAWANGTLDVTGNAVLVTVARKTTPSDDPDGPFSATKYGIKPIDGDGVGMNTVDLDVDGDTVNEHKDLGVTATLRFGRLRLQNALGSERLPLTVPAEVQYWNGTGFVTNTDDNCTKLQQSDIALDFNPPSALAACETAVNTASVVFTGGKGSIVLAAPGVGNTGSLLLTVNLNGAAGNYCNPGTLTTATNANRPYLLGRWNDDPATGNPDGNALTNYDDSPSARAAFGLYGGRPNTFIFQRENF